MTSTNPHASLQVYKASAGSGKTFTLSLEYIYRLLLKVQEGRSNAHQYILAITFTNKATAEMKSRFLGYLYDLKTGVENGFTEQLRQMEGICARDLQKNAAKALGEILHDYDHFHVKTIDSFLQGLLNQLAHELGIAANSSVSLNDEETIGLAVSHFLDQIRLDGAKEKRDDERTRRRLKWLTDFVEKRVDENKSGNLEKDLVDFTKTNVLSDEFQMIDKTVEDEQCKRKYVYSSENLKAYSDNLKALVKQRQEELKKKAEEALAACENIMSAISRFNNYSSPLQKIIHGEMSDDLSNSFVSAANQTQVEKGKKLCLFKKGWEKVTTEAEGLAVCAKLHDVVESYDSYQYLSNSVALIDKTIYPIQILEEIDGFVNEVNEELNHVLLSRTKQIFSMMIREEDSPFLFEKAGITYENIMIDEFQDTAKVQWDNIKKLFHEQLSQGKPTMIVGDVKQSIYRWNGGDWKILQNIGGDSEPFEVGTNTLSNNFRSKKEVVEFNNAFFKEAAAKLEEMHRHSCEQKDTAPHLKVRELYDDVEQVAQKGEGGYVKAICCEYKKTWGKKTDKEEAQNTDVAFTDVLENGEENPYSLFHQVQLLHDNGVEYKDMTILVRTNRQTVDILNYFTMKHGDAKLPIISQLAFQMQSSPYVSLLIHTLKWLYSKQMAQENKVEWLLAARLYTEIVCGVEDYDKEAMIDYPGAFLPPALNEERHLGELFDLPLYDLMMKLVEILELNKGEEHLAHIEGQKAFMMFFLDSVTNYLNKNVSSIGEFLEYWDAKLHKMSIPSPETDGIQIMTVHKSKGLAFHTVLMPLCNWNLVGKKVNMNYYWWATDDFEIKAMKEYEQDFSRVRRLPIIPNSAKTNKSIFNKQYAQEMSEVMIDEFNSLYVAFTRCTDNLVFWANTDDKNTKDGINKGNWDVANICMKCLPVENRETGKIFEYVKGQLQGGKRAEGEPAKDKLKVSEHIPFPMNEEKRSLNLEFVFRDSKQRFRQSSLSQEFWESEEDEIRRQGLTPIQEGNLYHNILAHIQDSTEVEKAVRKMDAQGLIPLEVDANQVIRKIKEKLEDERVKDWFAPNKWKVYNENAIVTRQEAEVKQWRPDRVMFSQEETIVIDFKFGRPREEHKAQVTGYMELLKTMGYAAPKGFLWYVDQNKIEAF